MVGIKTTGRDAYGSPLTTRLRHSFLVHHVRLGVQLDFPARRQIGADVEDAVSGPALWG